MCFFCVCVSQTKKNRLVDGVEMDDETEQHCMLCEPFDGSQLLLPEIEVSNVMEQLK